VRQEHERDIGKRHGVEGAKWIELSSR
jgi:hypothetical protein